MNDLSRQRSPLRLRTDEQRDREAKLRDLLENDEWEDITARLTASAYRLMRKKRPLADAEDAAQKAICQFLDPDYKDWDPEEQTLLKHLESVMVGIIHDQYVNVGERMREKAVDIDRHRIESEAPTVEAEVITRERGRLVFGALRDHFAAMPLESALVELFAQGHDLPREQVQELGQPYMKVYKARARVTEEARRILAELEKTHGNE